jgi:hypothetical protein
MKRNNSFNPYISNEGKSIFEGLKTFAAQKFPADSKWDMCSDITSQRLLNTILGTPIGYISSIRIFHKTVACILLGKHLLGIEEINREQAREMYNENINIHRSTDYRKLLEYKC